MSGQKPSTFATYQSLSRMAILFKAQTKLLDELLSTKLSGANRPLLPLIGAIKENSKAILLFERAGLLNELMLVQRVFVQRIINCCYLMVAENDDVARYFEHPIVHSGGTLKDGSADSFIEFAKGYNSEGSATAIALPLAGQAELIAAKTGIPKDLFLVALASVFPKSSEILAGSLFGATFHFGAFAGKGKVEESQLADRHGELFFTLYLSIELLDALFKTAAKTDSIDINKKSAVNTNAADQLTLGLFGKKESDLTHADGAWERLDKIEYGTNEHFENLLSDFAPAFRDAYDLGFLVATLKPKNTTILDLNFAALFLKRILNDLRVVWRLLLSGYTSQAAAVAATLYESALASICLTLSQKDIDKYSSMPSGEIPWNKAEMAKKVARADKRVTSGPDQEELWKAIYKHYTWLCGIKHASRSSLIHDAKASEIPGRGFVVMAIPNLSEQDLEFKAGVALISLIYTLDSVRAFANALGYDDDFPDEFGFKQTYQRAREASGNLFDKYLNKSKIKF